MYMTPISLMYMMYFLNNKQINKKEILKSSDFIFVNAECTFNFMALRETFYLLNPN